MTGTPNPHAQNAPLDHIAAHTYHGRKGAVKNAFRYSVDFILCDAESTGPTPKLFSRNKANLASIRDRDHGGDIGDGHGADWVRAVLRDHQLDQPARICLLAQPRLLGHAFNPVSFWLCYSDDQMTRLTSVIAEVTNTFGERHSYICHHPDQRAITPQDRLGATKVFHVSPFQPVNGGYTFRFDIGPDRIGIWIDYLQAVKSPQDAHSGATGTGGLIATLTGTRKPLSNRAILWSCLRRPFGSRRVLALIHWQAAKLWWKRATFRARPLPPDHTVSRG